MNQIEIQLESKSINYPDQHEIQQWVDSALEDVNQDTEIVVRIVDEPESAFLNKQYRHKSGSTNILSFPFEIPEGLDQNEINLLGDLVICAPVLEREAIQQQKQLAHHWAHIIVHGILHLLGYDHGDEENAEIMESKEILILKKLKINNPYRHEA
jgi:probable rRNA maturation factor